MKKFRCRVWLLVVIAIFLFLGFSKYHLDRKLEMYPGLGLRDLHQTGINGAGISVAIIDQKLLVNHVEYVDRLVHYQELQPIDEPNSMHGPAVSSILVGKNCGVAPGADLHYWAVPVHGDELPGIRYAQAIKDVISYNSSLPEKKRIRVLSISSGFQKEDGGDQFLEAVEEAWDSGLLVFTSTFPYFTDPIIAVYTAALKRGGSRDHIDDYIVPPLLVEYRGQTAEVIVRTRHQQGDGNVIYEPVWVPVEPRLLASQQGPRKYTLYFTGGDSWAPPYLAGVAALILQVNPRLSNKQVVEIIAANTVENSGGLMIVSPEQAVIVAQEPIAP